MTGKKFRKLVIHIVGEVLLIAIGILFALQIDNWNEARKDAALELQMLKGIRADLNINAQKLQEVIEMDADLVTGNQYLLEIIRDPYSEYSSDLDELFGSINRYMVFYPQRMAYESLKSKGFDVIQNEALKSAIINLYDYEYMSNSAVEMELKRGLYESSNVVFLRHLDTGAEVFLKRPLDFEALKNDPEFVNHLAHITAEQRQLAAFSEEHLRHTLLVLEETKAEIDRRER